MNKRFTCALSLALLVLGSFSLVACSTVAENAAPLTEITEAPDMTLSAGDVLKITVFNDEDLSGEYTIDRDGFITMPLIGKVKAETQTLPVLQENITAALKDGILVDPKISIELASLRPFYILGEVRNPGSYPAAPHLDVFKAVAIAGGVTPRGVEDRFIIYRGFGKDRIKIVATEATPVLPGDSIRVQERFF